MSLSTQTIPCESLGTVGELNGPLATSTLIPRHHPDHIRRLLSPSPPSASLPPCTSSSITTTNNNTQLLTPSPPSDPGPSSLRSMDATYGLTDTPLSYSRVKAFPHNADLLGGRSEGRRSLLSRTSSPAVEEGAMPRTVEVVNPNESPPPPRQRRRTSLDDSRTTHAHRDPPHLAAFEQNSFRGEGIHELGSSMHQHQPTAYRPRPDYEQDLPSFTLSSSSSDDDPGPVRLALPSIDPTQMSFVSPRLISANRRIPTPPAVRTPPPLVRPLPLSELMFAYGNMGESLAEHAAAADPLPVPTVPPPRPSPQPTWNEDEGHLNFSPERIRERNAASRPRLHHPHTDHGLFSRSQALRSRLARLDALRTQSSSFDLTPAPAPPSYGGLFGSSAFPSQAFEPGTIASVSESMEIDAPVPSNQLFGDIGRWNDNVQEALARRVSAERPPPAILGRRHREGIAPYSRHRQSSGSSASNLAYDQPAASGGPSESQPAGFTFPHYWGEIPIDTATTGLHDIHQPRTIVPTPVSLAAQQYSRRAHLPRAFELPEQRAPDRPPATSGLTPRPRLAQHHDQSANADWLDVARDVLGWRLPDVARGPVAPSRHSSASSRVDAYLSQQLGSRPMPRWASDMPPRQHMSTQSSTSTGPDTEVYLPWEGPTNMFRSSELEHITPYPMPRDSLGAHRHMHDRANICRGMQMKPGMSEADKLLLARAVGRSLSRWGPEVRRKAARAVVEQVKYGQIGQREGMDIDLNCSICHDEVGSA